MSGSAMAAPSCFFRYLTFLMILLRNIDADTLDAFSFSGFRHDESSLGFYGDVKLVNGSSSGYSSVSLSDGRLLFQNPIRFVQGKPRKMVSFSTYFSVLLAPENSEGISFFLVPVANHRFKESFLGVSRGLNETNIRVFVAGFDALKDGNGGSLNGSYVGVDVSGLGSLGMNNVSSSVNLGLNSGDVLHCWIEYQAGSRRFEIRLSKSGGVKPMKPSFVYTVDLSIKWKEEEVFMGLSSSSKSSSCIVYSWSFKLWAVPQWMHSKPVDPAAMTKSTRTLALQKNSPCGAKVLGALFLGAGCGALGAFIVLFVWSSFLSRRPVVPEEASGCPGPAVYDCEKVVLVDKPIKDGCFYPCSCSFVTM